MSELSKKLPAGELPALDVTLINDTNLSYFSTFIPSEWHAAVEKRSLCALGAISEGTACAALIAEIDDACVQLRSIFVAPAYRRQYIASTLIGELLDYIIEDGNLAIQSVAVEYADDGGGMKEFLDSIGFQQEKLEEKTFSLPVSSFPGCKFMRRTRAPGVTILPLESLTAYHLREISSVMDSYDADYFGKRLGPETVLTGLSFAAYQDNKPVGCVCLSEGAKDEELVMTSFFFTGKTLAIPMALLHAAAEAVLRNCTEVSEIKIPILNENAGKLLQALTGGAATVCETMYSAVLEV